MNQPARLVRVYKHVIRAPHTLTSPEGVRATREKLATSAAYQANMADPFAVLNTGDDDIPF